MELSVAVPQVVAHRMVRMAMAGPVLSARDRKEFAGMVAEKQQAFAQSWVAMLAESARQQQRFLLSCLGGVPSIGKHAAQSRSALSRIASAGLSPVHRKALGARRT
ncbi:MAG: hypothetical protein ABIR94_09560 [Rubrivivax sp.]